MADKCYALMRGNTIYTLRPYKDPFDRKVPFKWQGFIDGQAWRLFKTKAEFEQAVDLEPRPAPLGPHATAAFRAETWSTHLGNRLLDAIREQYARRKAVRP